MEIDGSGLGEVISRLGTQDLDDVEGERGETTADRQREGRGGWK